MLWTDTVAGLTATARQALYLDNIGGSPVIVRDRLVVVGGSDRTVSFDINRGIQVWELPFGGTQRGRRCSTITAEETPGG